MRVLIICFIIVFSPGLYAQEIKVADSFKDSTRGIEIQICSDSITADSIFGESYRLLLIKRMDSDTVLMTKYLDINNSPDFPYDINSNYAKTTNLVIIQGVGGCYLYDLQTNGISEKIYPDLSGCAISDNQGSYLMDSKLSENGKIFSVKILECDWFNYKIEGIGNITFIGK